MKNKLFSAAFIAALTLTACQSTADETVIERGEQAQVGFSLAGEFQVEDGTLTRAVTPEYYYIAVSADAPSDGKISTGYAGYFTTLSGVSLTLPKGSYTFYISAFKSTGYTIDWSTDYSALTAGEFVDVTSPVAYAPCFADQKVDRYYGKTTQAINANTTVTVDGKRFAYGIKVDIASPLEGKVVLGSESPAFSYTVTSTDAAKVEQNIFCLAGEDPTTASKTTTVTMNLYNAAGTVVATTSKELTIARNHSKTLKVKALDPKANFVFNVEDGSMTNDGEVDMNPSTPDFNGHDYVDLGITDGSGNKILWATCNVGATNPEDYGLYFAWGATTGCDNTTGTCRTHTFNWPNTPFNGGNSSYSSDAWDAAKSTAVDANNVLLPANDAATANWGGSWRMPTSDERAKLLTECYWQWVTSYKGKTVNGYVVYKAKSANDKGKYSYKNPTPSETYSVESDTHIFLPAAGYRDDSGLDDGGSYGCYWSSSLYDESIPYYAWGLLFCSRSVDADNHDRYYGRSVRPVCLSSE